MDISAARLQRLVEFDRYQAERGDVEGGQDGTKVKITMSVEKDKLFYILNCQKIAKYSKQRSNVGWLEVLLNARGVLECSC